MDTTKLQIGDRVGASGYYADTKFTIHSVARRTDTQVILDDGSRWNKDGRKIGDGETYRRQFLVTEQEALESNADIDKRMERRALVNSVENLEFMSISDDGLRMILQIAKDHAL